MPGAVCVLLKAITQPFVLASAEVLNTKQRKPNALSLHPHEEPKTHLVPSSKYRTHFQSLSSPIYVIQKGQILIL